MAYLRDEKESFEIDYPLETLWAAIPKVAETLEWTIEEKNDSKHYVKFKTKAGFLAYSTTVSVEAKSVDEKTTRMSINAETPVTTITSMVDIGRTRYRVDSFVEALAKQMEKKSSKPSSK